MLIRIIYIIIIVLSFIYSIYFKDNNIINDIIYINNDNIDNSIDINLSKYNKGDNSNDMERHIIILLRDSNISW